MKQQGVEMRPTQADKAINKSFADKVSRKLWKLDAKALCERPKADWP